MAAQRGFTRERRIAFLRALASSGNVSSALAMANVPRATAYTRRSTDPAFARCWAEAMEEATDALEAEARRRAVEGVQEPLIVGGKLVERNGQVVMLRRYSDQLLIVLLRAHSQKFKTSQPAPMLLPWQMTDEQLEAALEQCRAHAEGQGGALARRHLRLMPKRDTPADS
jgi:hypothetical protein